MKSDGGFLISREDYCLEACLLDHDRGYFTQKKGYIMRYLITAPVGYALLLGSSRYETSLSPLKCVGKDLSVMEDVLNRCGWKVDCPFGVNTEKEGCERVIRELGRNNLDMYSCFMFYFSGHGSQEGMLFQPNGRVVSYRQVVDAVLALKNFCDKPKIIIFDCCRTDNCQEGEKPLKSLEGHFASNDTVVCFACTHNTASVALGAAGSIFTQNFANKLQELGHEVSFVDLLTQVKGETYNMTITRFGLAQEADIHFGLNYQLLLKGLQ